MQFSTAELMAEAKCYEWLVNILHTEGLRSPRRQLPLGHSAVHRLDRAPMLYLRCLCGPVYKAFAGTFWEGTHHRCSCIVRILQGSGQGLPSVSKLDPEDPPRCIANKVRGHATWDNDRPPSFRFVGRDTGDVRLDVKSQRPQRSLAHRAGADPTGSRRQYPRMRCLLPSGVTRRALPDAYQGVTVPSSASPNALQPACRLGASDRTGALGGLHPLPSAGARARPRHRLPHAGRARVGA